MGVTERYALYGVNLYDDHGVDALRTVGTRIPDDVYMKLKEAAERESLSISELLRRLIYDYLGIPLEGGQDVKLGNRRQDDIDIKLRNIEDRLERLEKEMERVKKLVESQAGLLKYTRHARRK